MAQNETAWLLDAVLSNWPQTMFPSDLVRLNNDKPELVSSGRRTKEIELTKHNVVRAGLGDRVREVTGPEFWYDIETVVDVGVEGAHQSQYGHVADDESFRLLVNRVQRAIDDAREFPTVPDNGTTVGKVAYHTAIIQNEQPDLDTHEDHYQTEFEVALRGKQER